jgi:hypothetical protein
MKKICHKAFLKFLLLYKEKSCLYEISKYQIWRHTPLFFQNLLTLIFVHNFVHDFSQIYIAFLKSCLHDFDISNSGTLLCISKFVIYIFIA